jgi:acrylyl-CoA reductase (NADPH)
MCSSERRVEAWERLARDLPLAKLEAMIQPAKLADLPELGRAIFAGQVRGRVVVEIGA